MRGAWPSTGHEGFQTPIRNIRSDAFFLSLVVLLGDLPDPEEIKVNGKAGFRRSPIGYGGGTAPP